MHRLFLALAALALLTLSGCRTLEVKSVTFEFHLDVHVPPEGR